jgi:hypothetical protein
MLASVKSCVHMFASLLRHLPLHIILLHMSLIKSASYVVAAYAGAFSCRAVCARLVHLMHSAQGGSPLISARCVNVCLYVCPHVLVHACVCLCTCAPCSTIVRAHNPSTPAQHVCAHTHAHAHKHTRTRLLSDQPQSVRISCIPLLVQFAYAVSHL